MGLLDQLRSTKRALTSNERKARSVRKDPRDAHDAKESAKQNRREIKELEQVIDTDRELVSKLEKVAEQLAGDPFKSRCRAVTISKLEEAAMWLRKEVGFD